MAHQQVPRCLFTLLLVTLTLQVSLATYCTNDSDCPTYQLCILRTCSRGATGTGDRCSSPSDCSGSARCHLGECACTHSYQCPGAELCQNGICKQGSSGCTSSIQCPGDQICYSNSCMYCTSSIHCPGSKRCINMKCKDLVNDECEYSSDCRGSKICRYSTCVEPNSPTNTGLAIFLWIVAIILGIVTVIVVLRSCSRTQRGRVIAPPPPIYSVPPQVGIISPQMPVNCQTHLTSATYAYSGGPPSYYEATGPCPAPAPKTF